jgi:cold shock CspA family protein
MRQQGRLSEWNDARGFGFVQPHGGGDRCFVHIGAFAGRDRRHKNRKASFQTTFWDAVVINLVALAWIAGGGLSTAG